MRIFELDRQEQHFVLDTQFFHQPTLGFTFYSTNGREGAGSTFVKTEVWNLLSISLPRRGEGDSSMNGNSGENSTESQLQLRG